MIELNREQPIYNKQITVHRSGSGSKQVTKNAIKDDGVCQYTFRILNGF